MPSVTIYMLMVLAQYYLWLKSSIKGLPIYQIIFISDIGVAVMSGNDMKYSPSFYIGIQHEKTDTFTLQLAYKVNTDPISGW